MVDVVAALALATRFGGRPALLLVLVPVVAVLAWVLSVVLRSGG